MQSPPASSAPPTTARSHRLPLAGRIAATVAGIVVGLGLLLAAFPWGLLRGPIERTLTSKLGRSVVIGSAERLDHFSLEPLLRLSSVRIAQPAWAGSGDMVSVGAATVRFSVLALLRGKFAPIDVELSGVRLDLVREASGRSNWSDGKKSDDGSDNVPRLRHLRIADSSLKLNDAKRHIVLAATLAADAGSGVTITGNGSLRGRPVQLQVVGGKLDDIDPATRYPFRIGVVSDLVRLSGSGTMDHVFDTGHFTASVTASGADLAYLDDIIQAGVPATQDFKLAATVRHDNPDWKITRLAGTIGRSDLTGSLIVRKRDGRSVLDGELAANQFDFDDLASDEQRRRAAEKRRLTGRRFLPETAIHFEKLSRTDGVIRFSAKKLLIPGKNPFVGLRATLTMDHRLLTVKPVQASLIHGTLGGQMVVDHREGDPKLTVDLDLRGARLEDIFTEARYASAPLDGRIRLKGVGRTVRSALGRGDGTIALISRGGEMRKDVATLAAGDVIRGARLALSDRNDEMVPIRCAVGEFVARQGKVSATDVILDTSVMRAGGSGTLDLSDESIEIKLTGRSKRPDVLQTTVPIHVGGTLTMPSFDVIPNSAADQKKGLFGRIGVILKSLRTRDDAGRDAVAPDAPCDALAKKILG